MKKIRGVLKLALGVTLLSPIFVSVGVGLGLKQKANDIEDSTFTSFVHNQDEDYQGYIVERDKKMDEIYKLYFKNDREEYDKQSDYYAYAPFMFDYMANTEKYGKPIRESQNLEKAGHNVLVYGILSGLAITSLSEAILNDGIYKTGRHTRGFYSLFKSGIKDLKSTSTTKKKEELVETTLITNENAEQNT